MHWHNSITQFNCKSIQVVHDGCVFGTSFSINFKQLPNRPNIVTIHCTNFLILLRDVKCVCQMGIVCMCWYVLCTANRQPVYSGLLAGYPAHMLSSIKYHVKDTNSYGDMTQSIHKYLLLKCHMRFIGFIVFWTNLWPIESS